MAEPPATIGFPTYATLTETAGWAQSTAAPIEGRAVIDLDGPRYVEGQLLGAGGMGKVVLVRDERIGREVAVKEIHAKRAASSDEEVRFLREARVQGQLEHPSIVPVYDLDRRPDGTIFFSMRRVVGKTLTAILEDVRRGAPGARTQHDLLTAFATVCLAVDYAHSRGVIHRDLKPANLMLGDFGEVYVLDWGLARLVADARISSDPPQRLSMPGDLLGTPLYMAPEQMADPEVGVAADVYALGSILFELLTLVPLRDPKAPYMPAEARPSVRAPDRNVAPELEAICVTATADVPADRFPSARALQEAVIRYLEGDRDRGLRLERAAAHARDARAALERADRAGSDFEAERGEAMRELVRALAFDPSNREHVTMLAELLDRPPRVVPPDVHQQMRAEGQRTMSTFAKYTAPTMASWFLFLPLMYMIGIRDASYLPWIAIPCALTAVIGFYVYRRSAFGPTMQIVALGFALISMCSTTVIYGPLITTPTLIIVGATVVQAFPSRGLRGIGFTVAGLALVILVLLELAGVTSSYSFADGSWRVVPHFVATPRVPTMAFALLTNLATMIAACLFVGLLRRDLSRAQEQLLVRSWHFRRLGELLMRTPA